MAEQHVEKLSENMTNGADLYLLAKLPVLSFVPNADSTAALHSTECEYDEKDQSPHFYVASHKSKSFRKTNPSSPLDFVKIHIV